MTFGDLVNSFYTHMDAYCKTTGLENPDVDEVYVRAALAGMLNDGDIRAALYVVHDEGPRAA